MQVTENKRRWFKSNIGGPQLIEKYLAELTDGKMHLVALDGYLEEKLAHTAMCWECVDSGVIVTDRVDGLWR
eukprot:762691-Hanusia_phi.AAC.6